MPLILKRLDHVLINSLYPSRLLDTFRQFGLPQAWPLTTQSFYTSGGVSFGNINVEVIHFGESPALARTRLFGLAFEPVSLAESLDELARRGIPHGPPTPLSGADGQRWTTVVIGDLLGKKSGTFSLGRFGGNSALNHWVGRQSACLVQSSWGKSVVARTLVEPMTFLVDYNTPTTEVWQTDMTASFDAARGGRLGIEAVEEIVIGVEEFERTCRKWQEVFNPMPPVAEGVWEVDRSPTIRLVADEVYRIKAMTLRVASLRRATDELRRLQMLSDCEEGRITIDRSEIEGLEIHCVEQAKAR